LLKNSGESLFKIDADMAAMLSDPAIKEKFKVLGVFPRSSTPQELAAMNAADDNCGDRSSKKPISGSTKGWRLGLDQFKVIKQTF
jgi:hypothetical protein